MPNELITTDTSALFDSRTEEILTVDERILLATVLSRNDRVDLVFPDGMSAAELWRTFDVCTRTFVVVGRAKDQLKSLIGRALCVIQDTPEIFESRGFRNFNDFMSDEQRGLPAITGICRNELYKAKSIAKAFGPDFNPDDASQIGFTKLRMIATVTSSGDSNFEELKEAAKTDTIPQLSERIAVMGLAERGELEYDVLQVTVTKAQKRFIAGFLSNPQVRAFCESEFPGAILERMVGECQSEWTIRNVISDISDGGV